jgi:hypothetical protein
MMLIEPLYPNADEDQRLVCVKTEADKLKAKITDIEWEGGDVAFLKTQWQALNEKVLAGVRYEPLF